MQDGFFRGDLVPKPDGGGRWIVSSDGGSGLRLVDFERRQVVWQARPGQNSQADVQPRRQTISVPVREDPRHDAI